jgi:YaiO family outer membrane protein
MKHEKSGGEGKEANSWSLRMPESTMGRVTLLLCWIGLFAVAPFPSPSESVAASPLAKNQSRTSPEVPGATADTITSWFGGVRLEREFISSTQPQWTDWIQYRGFLIRDFSRGAVGLEVAQIERFGQSDEVLVLDNYLELWTRSYANLRVRWNPKPDVLPNADVRAEVFQAFENGWEISGSYWRMDFDEEDVDVLGAGMAKYLGNWYLRQVTLVSWLADQPALSASVAARRFLNPPREYMELSGGLGEEVVVVGPGPTVETRETRFVRTSFQWFFSSHWGLAAAAMYNHFEGAPDRWGLSVGLLSQF